MLALTDRLTGLRKRSCFDAVRLATVASVLSGTGDSFHRSTTIGIVSVLYCSGDLTPDLTSVERGTHHLSVDEILQELLYPASWRRCSQWPRGGPQSHPQSDAMVCARMPFALRAVQVDGGGEFRGRVRGCLPEPQAAPVRAARRARPCLTAQSNGPNALTPRSSMKSAVYPIGWRLTVQ